MRYVSAVIRCDDGLSVDNIKAVTAADLARIPRYRQAAEAFGADGKRLAPFKQLFQFLIRLRLAVIAAAYSEQAC